MNNKLYNEEYFGIDKVESRLKNNELHKYLVVDKQFSMKKKTLMGLAKNLVNDDDKYENIYILRDFNEDKTVCTGIYFLGINENDLNEKSLGRMLKRYKDKENEQGKKIVYSSSASPINDGMHEDLNVEASMLPQTNVAYGVILDDISVEAIKNIEGAEIIGKFGNLQQTYFKISADKLPKAKAHSIRILDVIKNDEMLKNFYQGKDK